MKDVLLYGPSIPRRHSLQGCKGLGDVGQEITAAQNAITSLNVSISAQQSNLENKTNLLKNNQKNIDDCNLELEQKQNEVSIYTTLLQSNPDDATVSKLTAAQNRITQLKKYLNSYNSQKEELTASIAKIQNNIADMEAQVAQQKRIIANLQSIQSGNDMFNTPTVTVTVAPTVAPATVTTTPTPEPTPTQTRTTILPEPEPDPTPEPEPEPVFSFNFDDDGDAAALPEGDAGNSDTEIYDLSDEAPDTETTGNIPWYVYALGAGALLLGGVLIFGGKKNKKKDKKRN